MSERDVDILIVGGGLAGASCAEALREGGFDGSVLLVGRRAAPALRAPAVLEGPAPRRVRARRRAPAPGRLVRGARHRAADAHERARSSTRRPRRRSSRTSRRCATTARCSRRAPTSTGCASRAATTTASTTCARSAPSVSLREDAEDAEKVVLIGGSLHRVRGGRLADRDGQAVHAGDARGRRRCRPASARPRVASSPTCSARTGSSSSPATAWRASRATSAWSGS